VSASSLARHAARVALATLALIASIGVLVRTLGAGDEARELLGFRFDRPGRHPRDAIGVAATNLRLVAAALVAAWSLRICPRLRPPLDITLAAVLALNTVPAGVALGAYGSRLLGALALHGPVELAAFALAGGAYLAARAGEPGAVRLALAAGGAVVLVAAGAALETYVQIVGDR
jgi:hypothetical protein